MFDINTEYFNGHEWKRICDYTIGDKVLAYQGVNGKKEKLPPFTSCVAKGEYCIILPDSYYLVCKNKNHIFISGGY